MLTRIYNLDLALIPVTKKKKVRKEEGWKVGKEIILLRRKEEGFVHAL